MTIREAIARVVDGENLTEAEAIEVMTQIMDGETTEAQIASFLTALRMKGETVEEITGCARVMRDHAIQVRVAKPKEQIVDIDRDEINIDWETIVDTCGTGGDNTHTFNISTTTAFVVAGAGVLVAKHGNRSVSSRCGSADVVEALGVNLEVPRGIVEKCVNNIGIGFLYAPSLHAAMRYAISPRKQIGIRTVFNILGPLTNPARATSQVLGVYKPELTETLAYVLKGLGSKRAFIVYGKDALDEISITGKTRISELNRGEVRTYDVQPEDFGLERGTLDDIRGGDTKENARITRDILEGKDGPRRDIVLLNAGFALCAAGKVENVKDGIKMARESIDSGKALKKLEKLIEFTNQQ